MPRSQSVCLALAVASFRARSVGHAEGVARRESCQHLQRWRSKPPPLQRSPHQALLTQAGVTGRWVHPPHSKYFSGNRIPNTFGSMSHALMVTFRSCVKLLMELLLSSFHCASIAQTETRASTAGTWIIMRSGWISELYHFPAIKRAAECHKYASLLQLGPRWSHKLD